MLQDSRRLNFFWFFFIDLHNAVFISVIFFWQNEILREKKNPHILSRSGLYVCVRECWLDKKSFDVMTLFEMWISNYSIAMYRHEIYQPLYLMTLNVFLLHFPTYSRLKTESQIPESQRMFTRGYVVRIPKKECPVSQRVFRIQEDTWSGFLKKSGPDPRG